MATTTTIKNPTTQKQVAANDIAAKTTVANAASKNVFLNQSQINKITAGQSTNTTAVNPNKVTSNIGANATSNIIRQNDTVNNKAGTVVNSSSSSSSSQDLTIPTPTPSKLEQEVSNMSFSSWQPTYTTGANGQVTSTDPQTIAYMNWVSKQSSAGVDSSQLTPDKFTAGGMAENANRSQVGYTESLGLQGTITPQDIKTYGSYENAVVQKQLLQNEADRHNLEEQNKQAGRASDLASEEENKQAEGAKSAMASAFASGREGVMSASNALLSPEFSASVNNKLEQNSISRGLAENQRNQVYQQLLDAQASGNDKLAESLSKQVSAYDTQIQQIKAEQKKINDEASAEAFDRITKLSALSKDSGGGIFTGWTPQDIATAFNIPLGNATIVANADAKLASMDTSDIDYAQKVANLKKTQQETIWSGMTTEQRNYTFAQGLKSESDKQAFLNFAGKNPQFQFIKSGESIYAANPDTGKMELVVGEDNGIGYKPTGELVTNTIGNKTLTLDSGAMTALQQVNLQLKSQGLGDLVFSKGFRDQKDTIRQMAADNGIVFNEANPNATAALLRAAGHQVADVGKSNHENGMAVDIVDNSQGYQYVNSIKDIMNKNGWYQDSYLISKGDVGHFDFKGNPANKVYNEAQKKQMDNMDPAKVDKDELKANGLTVNDYWNYKATTQAVMSDKQKTQIDESIQILNELITDPALSGAVGPISAKFPTLRGGTADFEQKFRSLQAKLALDNLSLLKGPMSDKDIQFIKDASSVLNLGMSEQGFKTELIRLRDKFTSTKDNSKDPSVPARRQLTDPAEIQSVYTELQTMSEVDGRKLLESKGIDSSQFYN